MVFCFGLDFKEREGLRCMYSVGMCLFFGLDFRGDKKFMVKSDILFY